MQTRRARFLLTACFALAPLSTSALAKSKIDGDWEGTLDHGKLRLVFHIKVRGGTTVDSPQQSVHGLWAAVQFEGKTLQISMPGAGAEFHGRLEKAHITGVFQQTGSRWPLILTRSSQKAAGRNE